MTRDGRRGAPGKAVREGDGSEMERPVSKVMTRTSSTSEKPLCQPPRKLTDWLNPDGQRKVHSLVDKVYQPKNLRAAWEKVKANRGSGGVDGQSLEEFDQDVDAHLCRLHEELRTDCYQPLPVRRVDIPKAGTWVCPQPERMPEMLRCPASSSRSTMPIVPERKKSMAAEQLVPLQP